MWSTKLKVKLSLVHHLCLADVFLNKSSIHLNWNAMAVFGCHPHKFSIAKQSRLKLQAATTLPVTLEISAPIKLSI